MSVPFRHEIICRYSDIDQQQHVNNVKYFDYLQDARVALLFSIWRSAMGDLQQVLVHQEMSYRKPLLLSVAPITVEVWVSKIGNSSYTLSYRILDDQGDLAAEASTTLATLDPPTGRPTRIPDDLRALLEGLRIEA
jgi:acyl-CoA thioester hydrolase